MSTLVQHYTDAVTKSQAIFLESAQAWAQYVQEGSQNLTEQASNPRDPVNPVELIDGTFDRFERILGMQRDMYRGLAEAVTPYTEAVTSEATKVTERATEAFNQEATGARRTARAKKSA